jgi:YesN/AraC family two-component response regulator
VVDDDPGVLALYCRLVEQAGCRPLPARHGRAALEVLEHTRPDLILLDLMMPEMDGFAVLDVLRARESTRGIPVIVLIGHAVDEADMERLSRGVAAVLSKGLFSATETLNCIEAVLACHPVVSGSARSLIRRAMGFIHAHYAEPLTREQIARHVSISPGHLSDCFRRGLGVTPVEYLKRYRIHRACELLLENTDQTITQIAFGVGFTASAHFSRAFKRQVGVTPRAYRRGERGRHNIAWCPAKA